MRTAMRLVGGLLVVVGVFVDFDGLGMPNPLPVAIGLIGAGVVLLVKASARR